MHSAAPVSGLVDLDSMSAAVLSDSHPEQVVIYGNDVAYSQMIELFDRWDQLGHPSIHDLQISALLGAPKFVPDGHWIIAKRVGLYLGPVVGKLKAWKSSCMPIRYIRARSGRPGRGGQILPGRAGVRSPDRELSNRRSRQGES